MRSCAVAREDRSRYEKHVNVDRTSKLIVDFKASEASANDGAQLQELVGPEDQVVHADYAYNRDLARDHLRGIGARACLQMKGTRHVKLTAAQRQPNRWDARTRVRVKHVSASISNRLHADHLRYIDQKCVATAIPLTNLLHHILRVGQLHALRAWSPRETKEESPRARSLTLLPSSGHAIFLVLSLRFAPPAAAGEFFEVPLTLAKEWPFLCRAASSQSSKAVPLASL